MKTSNKIVILCIFLPIMCVAVYSIAPTVFAYTYDSCYDCGYDCGWYSGEEYLGCYGNSVYWFDECNLPVEFVEDCYSDEVCSNGQCMLVNIDCYDDLECGTNGFVGGPFCQGNSIYKNYKTYTCNYAGTTSSYCTSSTSAQLQTTCSAGQTCSNGTCDNINIACSSNTQCGTNGFVGDPFCQGNSVYRNYKTYTCNNPGTSSSYCSNATSAQLQTTCSANQTCNNGTCIGSCTPNQEQRCVGTSLYWYDSCGNQGSYIGTCGNQCTPNQEQRCVGTSLYWYDSCGNQGSYIGTCGQTNATLSVTKTVRNLTTNTSFASSVYANPSDVLMFLITLRNNGSQNAQNVYVRDSLPANLTYNNQMIVARSNNSYGSYSGDIMSGLNLNTIPAGQTATVTYQTQVAGVASFIYGTTTLTNTVSTTSSNVSYIPNASASVIVTRTGVLGASIVATGLTNNFWIDSFLLPLLVTLILIWMWRAGMFFGIEKWLDNKRKTRRGYKANKELSAKISHIQKIGR